MYRHTLTVPLFLNSGLPVPLDDVATIEARLLDLAGGFTVAGAIGRWRGAEETYAQEEVTVYTIDCQTNLVPALRQLAEWIALALQQESVLVTRAPLLDIEFIAAPTLERG